MGQGGNPPFAGVLGGSNHKIFLGFEAERPPFWTFLIYKYIIQITKISSDKHFKNTHLLNVFIQLCMTSKLLSPNQV